MKKHKHKYVGIYEVCLFCNKQKNPTPVSKLLKIIKQIKLLK